MIDPIDRLHQENLKFLKTQQYVKPNYVPFGQEIELLVRSELRRQGYRVEWTGFNAPFDLLVDGELRVEVKGSRVAYKPTSRNYRYQAQIRNDQADVLVMVCVDEDGANHFFVIPSNKFRTGNLSITHRDPIKYGGRWSKFYGAWDAIRDALAGASPRPRQLQLAGLV